MTLRTAFLTAVLWLAMSALSWAETPTPIAIGFYVPVVRDFPRKDVEISLRFWTDELSRELNLTYKPIQLYDNMDDLRLAVQSGKVNFIMATSMGVVSHFADSELRDGFTAKNSADNYLLLVVRKGAGITKPGDLVGKRVGLLDGDELSQVYLETLMLKAWGTAGWSRLALVDRQDQSRKLILQLFFNKTDAALVEHNAFLAALALNPQIGKRLEVLDDYTFKGTTPHIGLFSAMVSDADRVRIIQAAMGLNKTPRGRQVLEIYRAEDMIQTSVSALAPYRALWHEHKRLLVESAHRVRK